MSPTNVNMPLSVGDDFLLLLLYIYNAALLMLNTYKAGQISLWVGRVRQGAHGIEWPAVNQRWYDIG